MGLQSSERNRMIVFVGLQSSQRNRMIVGLQSSEKNRMIVCGAAVIRGIE